MCSIGDEHLEGQEEKYLPSKDNIKLAGIKCNKCRELDPVVVLRGKDVYCKSCFLNNTVHKFKALLGKHKLIRPNDKVLIHHQIGHPSTALLHFLRTGLDLTTPKKLRFQVCVVYIEDNSQFSVPYRKEIIQNVYNELKQFNFDLQFVSFSNYIKNGFKLEKIWNQYEDLPLRDDDKVDINKIFDNKCKKTSRNDILHIMKRKLLIQVAKQLDCKFVFTPEISIGIASQLLTDISLGRGSNVPIDTGFCDGRDEEVKILRPLRLFDMKELVFYNRLNNLNPLSIKQKDVNPYSSVQNLMKKFVTDLQTGYPATVTTIMKTGDKLAIDKQITLKCRLCEGIITPVSNELTSAESTSFSHFVSTTKPNQNLSRQERYNEMITNYKLVEDDEYCYSCKSLKNLIKI